MAPSGFAALAAKAIGAALNVKARFPDTRLHELAVALSASVQSPWRQAAKPTRHSSMSNRSRLGQRLADQRGEADRQ